MDNEHQYTYPDLVSVEDWLNAKGYTGEAGACHQAMSLIRKLEKRVEELQKYEGMVRFIANDYHELSHDKAYWQRDEWKKRCKKLIEENNERR